MLFVEMTAPSRQSDDVSAAVVEQDGAMAAARWELAASSSDVVL